MKKPTIANTFILFGAALTFLACSRVSEVLPSPTRAAATPSALPPLSIDTRPGAANKDVTYCSPDGIAQKLDLYYPKDLANPMPIAVYVHGGGWTSGDKGNGAGIPDVRELLARGYVVASLDYRLAPQYQWPAQIIDVKCAIRFLRAHASALQIDPNRVGAWGGIAGGHLVAMLGTTDQGAGFDVGEFLDQSSRVQAVVDMFGPTDLTTLDSAPAAPLAKTVFGATTRDDPVLARASPVTYISPDDPPFLILQGDKDTTVPPSQSQEFYDRLKAAGVNATLVMVKNAGHGFAPVGGAISPSRAELTQSIADFFDKNLK